MVEPATIETDQIATMIKGLLSCNRSSESPSTFTTILNWLVNLFRKLMGKESWDEIDFLYSLEIWDVSDEILTITEEVARTIYGCTTIRMGDRLRIYHIHKKSLIVRATNGKIPKWMRSKVENLDVVVANESIIVDDNGDQLLSVVVR